MLYKDFKNNRNCETRTFPAVKVTIGRKMMPSLASGTFVQTAASTAMTAPDCE